MICGFCGNAYDEDRSQPACKACPLGTDCGLILCPHCGYENPGTPRWIAYLKSRLGGGSRTPDSDSRRQERERGRGRVLPEGRQPPKGGELPEGRELGRGRERRSLPVLTAHDAGSAP